MTNLFGRLKKLEGVHNINVAYKYQLFIGVGWAAGMWDTPEEIAKGYKIQPWSKAAGGTGEDVFYLPTWEAVEAFRTRPDVDLLIIRYGSFPDEQPSNFER